MADKRTEQIKQQLDQHHEWPSVFMFKFIMLNDKERTEPFLELFSETAQVQRKFSKAGKYVAFTVNEVMVNSDAVLQRYEDVGKIEGVIPL